MHLPSWFVHVSSDESEEKFLPMCMSARAQHFQDSCLWVELLCEQERLCFRSIPAHMTKLKSKGRPPGLVVSLNHVADSALQNDWTELLCFQVAEMEIQ